MSDLVETLKRDFRDPEYRHAYSTEFVDAKIGTQIKVLREQRGWSQEQLAEKAGMKQSRISALENVNYSAWSVNTLRRLARAFDVALTVEFKAFGSHIQDFERMSRRSLQVAPFDSDPLMQASVSAGSTTGTTIIYDTNVINETNVGRYVTASLPLTAGAFTTVNTATAVGGASLSAIFGAASLSAIYGETGHYLRGPLRERRPAATNARNRGRESQSRVYVSPRAAAAGGRR